MSPDLFLPIGACGAIGAVILIVAARRMMREEREADKKKTPAVAGDLSDVPAIDSKAGLPAAGVSGRPPTSEADGTVEVLRVLRHPQRGLRVEIGGRRYNRANEIKDRRHEVDLLTTIGALQQFVQLGFAAPVETKPDTTPVELPAGSEPLQLPSMNPLKQMSVLREREQKKAREKSEGPQTIVEQIEAILIKRLIGSPFEGRGIHMRPGLHGAAHIDVDGRAYESVEDVPDPAIKEFIKSAIREWEKTYDRRGK